MQRAPRRRAATHYRSECGRSQGGGDAAEWVRRGEQPQLVPSACMVDWGMSPYRVIEVQRGE
jgi:hypothetical protein